jgi:hypothetical protein
LSDKMIAIAWLFEHAGYVKSKGQNVKIKYYNFFFALIKFCLS